MTAPTPITDAIRSYKEGDTDISAALSTIADIGHVPYEASPEDVWAWDGGNGELDSFAQMQLAFLELDLTKEEKTTFRNTIKMLASGKVAAHLPGQHDQGSHGRGGGSGSLPDGDGDCYVAAMNHFMETGMTNKDVRLTHGTPIGQGAIEGVKFGHAWVEEPDASIENLTWVVDKANGNDVRMPAELYYKIGQIKKSEVHRYSFDEMAEKVSDIGTYGPWD